MASRNPFDTALGIYGVFLGIVMAVWIGFGLYYLDRQGSLDFSAGIIGFIGGAAVFMVTLLLTSGRLWASSLANRAPVNNHESAQWDVDPRTGSHELGAADHHHIVHGPRNNNWD